MEVDKKLSQRGQINLRKAAEQGQRDPALIQQKVGVVYINLVCKVTDNLDGTNGLEFLTPVSNIQLHELEHVLVSLGDSIKQKWEISGMS